MPSTACPLDCPDACTLHAEVGDGGVVSLTGDRRNPLTDGLVCGKVRAFDRHLRCEERLMKPAIQVGPKGSGRWRTVGWDEALDTIATKLAEIRDTFGGESILPLSYGGSNGVLTHECVDSRLFHRLGASRLDRALCAAPTSAAATGLYGRMPGVALEDYVHARLIVMWGVNPHASGIHHVPVLKAAKKAGAKLIVVDPRRTPLAKMADLHLPLRPGTDLPLALAVIAWQFEHGGADEAFLARWCTGADALRERAARWTPEVAAQTCGLDPADVRKLGTLWAETSPAVVRCGWGLERNRNGGSAAAAVLALPAVSGKLGVRGGGYTTSNSKAHPLDTSRAVAEPEPDTRLINMNEVGRVLTDANDPPIKALFTYCCNPAATLPNRPRLMQGLAREDLFHVVHEQVMTDTAQWADVLLPATTFLEHHDLAPGYGAMVLNRIVPVVDRVGESRPNYEVFAQLCERLGLTRDDDPVGPDALIDAILAATPDGERIGQELGEHGMARPSVGHQPIGLVDTTPRTPDGKIHLVPQALDAEAPHGLYTYQPDPGTERFPLALISPASAKTTNSTFGQLDRRPAHVAIHPEDASARGIEDGAAVRIDSAYGSVTCRARVSNEVRVGVLSLAKGIWSHRVAGDGSTTNAVAPDTLADLGGGATFNDARVQIVAL